MARLPPIVCTAPIQVTLGSELDARPTHAPTCERVVEQNIDMQHQALTFIKLKVGSLLHRVLFKFANFDIYNLVLFHFPSFKP